jgi:hypothetical protein
VPVGVAVGKGVAVKVGVSGERVGLAVGDGELVGLQTPLAISGDGETVGNPAPMASPEDMSGQR